MSPFHTSYKILPDQKLIVTNFQGRITIEELMKLNLRFIADPEWRDAYDVLMDFRESAAIAFSVDIHEYFEFFKKNIKLKNRIRSGILYSTPNVKYLFSVYKPIAALNKIETQSFAELERFFVWMDYSQDDCAVIRDALNAIKVTLPQV